MHKAVHALSQSHRIETSEILSHNLLLYKPQYTLHEPSKVFRSVCSHFVVLRHLADLSKSLETLSQSQCSMRI